MSYLVGLMGQSGHGKDTIGEYLHATYSFETYAFAKPLKDAIRSIFHVPISQLYDPVFKENVDPFWGVSMRQLMQFIGTELFREQMDRLIPDLGKDIWLKSFLKWRETQRSLDGSYPRIVVTDIRFQNEAELIKSLGGIIWRVERAELVPTMPESSSSHVSETELTKIDLDDWEIKNDGTIDDLFIKTEVAICHFFPEIRLRHL